MKNVILGIAGILASITVHASMIEQHVSQLVSFDMQKGTDLEKVNEGQVTITPPLNTIQLDLEETVKVMCFRAPCPALHGKTHNITVKLVSTTKGECNETIFTGINDFRPVDGGYTKIVVIDNVANVCDSKQAIPQTEVILTSGGLRGGFEQTHKMTGVRLEEVM